MRIFQMQRYTAIALVVFMTIHMIVLHYPPFHVDFNNIIDRLSQPLWKAIDIAFLLAVLIHAITGAYMVLTDLGPVNRYRRALAWIAVIGGVYAFYYGTITILAFQPPAGMALGLP